MTCPNCKSSDVEHKDHRMKEVTHAAAHAGGHGLHAAAGGHPAVLLITAGLWAANKLINVVSQPWTCNKCGYNFTR
jgi:hypothetical protein